MEVLEKRRIDRCWLGGSSDCKRGNGKKQADFNAHGRHPGNGESGQALVQAARGLKMMRLGTRSTHATGAPLESGKDRQSIRLTAVDA